MKKIISLMLVLIMCLSIAMPVFAAEDTFVPSISEKDGPQLVTITDDEGNPAIGKVLDADGNVIDYIDEDCLVVTPVSQAKTSELIPDDACALLLSVYDQLKAGTMKLPYEKFSAALASEKMVIRELVDMSWLCGDHPEIIAPAGVTIQLTFDLGVDADTDVYVMTYKHDEWNPIVKTVNNGDGTVTCEFEDFCPGSFSVRSGSNEPPVQTGDNAKLTVWIVLMAVAVVCLAALLFFRRRNVQKNA